MAEGISVRSWNDPPQLSFSQSGGSGQKKTLLNKRVPFPLNEPVHSEQSNLPQGDKKNCDKDNSPKLIAKTMLPSVSVEDSIVTTLEDGQKKSVEQESDINASDSEILTFVIATFEKILEKHSENCEKKLNEINQRINIMKKFWNANISKQVKNMMFKLAQELSNGNAEAALKIHCILMVDNVREVKQWMVGVKHIIEMERQCQSPSNESPATSEGND